MGFLAVFPAFSVGAEVFTNEENPYILTETEDEYAIISIREPALEYEMGRDSDCYVVVGSNNEYVFYYSHNNPPEGVTGFRETGLYTNDAQNTPVYTCPNVLPGSYVRIKKDGSEVWFVADSVLHSSTSPDIALPVIEQYVNGVLNNVVMLPDLRLTKSDMQTPDDRYQDWYSEFHFTADTIQITAPGGKQRVIDRQSGDIIFPESELEAEAKHRTVRVIGLLAVCSVVSALMIILVLYKRKHKQK